MNDFQKNDIIDVYKIQLYTRLECINSEILSNIIMSKIYILYYFPVNQSFITLGVS